jgi:PhzF family phenazine biosynthesis protein
MKKRLGDEQDTLMNFALDKAITEPGIFKVNSFVAEGCKGNPAGVCLLPLSREDEYCKKVANKIAASETAFVYKGDDIYHLKWFTPTGAEVALCGHATLAAASILWDKGYVDSRKTIRFTTKSGILSAKREGDYVTLDFPPDKITEIQNKGYDFGRILGLSPRFTAKTNFDYLVVIDSEEAVKNLEPDFEQLKKLQERGVIITARAIGKDYDFISRFFAPGIGIDEDPVTGSVHCALGKYWGGVLNKKNMVGYQASREGGMVRVTILKDRILLGGKTREVSIPERIKKSILSF